MRAVLLAVFCFLAVASVLAVLDHELPAINKDLISEVNANPKSTWKAGLNRNFMGKNRAQVKVQMQTSKIILGANLLFAQRMLGWKPSGKEIPAYRPSARVALPTNFDSAANWPKCTVIAHIWNQAE